jgi:hypothetical protein
MRWTCDQHPHRPDLKREKPITPRNAPGDFRTATMNENFESRSKDQNESNVNARVAPLRLQATRNTDLPCCPAARGEKSPFRFSEICDCMPASRFHLEGRLANRRKRGDGMRWTCGSCQACETSADGEAAWS